MSSETAIEMFVGGLMLDPNTQAPVVVLKDETGDIVLPIWIGVAEATSIASILKQVSMARPLTHDLMRDILSELSVKVQRVVITQLKDSTYYADLVLTYGEKVMIFDSRPSDAIALALRHSAPIFVTQDVLDQAKVAFSQQSGPVPKDEPVDNASGQEETGEQEPVGPSMKDLTNIDKDQWEDILKDLDPDDFKYKM